MISRKSRPTYNDQGKVVLPDRHQNFLQGVAAGEVRLDAIGHDPYLCRSLPRHLLPGLSSLGSWNVDHTLGWGSDFHYNEGIEVHFVEAGELSFSTCGERYVLEPGDATATRPWVEHCVGDPHLQAVRAYWYVLDIGVRRPGQEWRWPSWIVLTPTDRREFADLLATSEVHVWKAGKELEHCFQRMGKLAATDPGNCAGSLLAALVNESLALVLEGIRKPKAGSDGRTIVRRQVEQFWLQLRASPEQVAEEWTLKRMAWSCGIGETQFSHYTKHLANLSPLRYLRLLRLELAADRLAKHPERSVEDIALASGFSYVPHFSTRFREHFGMTPGDYRKNRASRGMGDYKFPQ